MSLIEITTNFYHHRSKINIIDLGLKLFTYIQVNITVKTSVQNGD